MTDIIRIMDYEVSPRIFDSEIIHERFRTTSPESVDLYAVNLTRPDGFAKTLIVGSLVTSKELAEEISPTFVRTHRGYYLSNDQDIGTNDHISFNVGRAQLMYAKSYGLLADDEFSGGLGFAFPVQDILSRSDSKVTYGNFNIVKAIATLENTQSLPVIYEKYRDLIPKQLKEKDLVPDKNELEDFVQIARMAGTLTGDDQGEVNLVPQDSLPQLKINTGLILVPARSERAIKRLVDTKLKEMLPYREQLQIAFGIDVTEITADSLLSKYPNILWYKEKNIDDAIMNISIKR